MTYSESFSVNFALKMAQLAESSGRLWFNHETSPYPDDDPTTQRHLRIRATLASDNVGFNYLEMDCLVCKTDPSGFWGCGSVVVIHFDRDFKDVQHLEPERFFEYSSGGMKPIRRVPISIVKAKDGFMAAALDNPDESQGGPLKTSRANRDYPSATGSTEYEALGALVAANPEFFQIVLRNK